jgi:hypothetical protein
MISFCNNKADSVFLGSKLQEGMRDLIMILTKWLLLTRLETRTKESTHYASVRVEKPKRVPKGMQDVKRKLQHQPILILR